MDKKRYARAQRSLTYGYVISALLTLSIYLIVMFNLWGVTIIAIVALVAAALQLLTQSRFFLHLGKRERQVWWMSTYLFTWLMLLIVTVGSLWVMFNLNYNMGMSPDQMLQKIQIENQKGF